MLANWLSFYAVSFEPRRELQKELEMAKRVIWKMDCTSLWTSTWTLDIDESNGNVSGYATDWINKGGNANPAGEPNPVSGSISMQVNAITLVRSLAPGIQNDSQTFSGKFDTTGGAYGSFRGGNVDGSWSVKVAPH